MRHTEMWNWRDVKPGHDDATYRAFQLPTRDNITVNRGETRNRAAFGNHTHPYDQWVHVLEGSGVMVCDGQEYRLRKGSVVRIPANTVHSVIYECDTVVLEIGLGRDPS